MLGVKKIEVNEKKEIPKMPRLRQRSVKEESQEVGGSSFIFTGESESGGEIQGERRVLASLLDVEDDEDVTESEPASVPESVPESVPKPEHVPASVAEPVPILEPASVADAQYVAASAIRGSRAARPVSVIEKLRKAAAEYNGRNMGIFSDDVDVRYEAGDLLEIKVTEDCRILLPNRRVYYCGMCMEWDRANEIRVKRGHEIELDLGVSFVLPDNYELEITGIKDMKAKYSLELVGGVIRVNRQTALFPLVLRLRAVEDLAYVQKYRSIVQARLINI